MGSAAMANSGEGDASAANGGGKQPNGTALPATVLLVEAGEGDAAARGLLLSGSTQPPAAPPEPTKPAAPASLWTTIRDWLVKLVPATVGAIGLVGFVGATGAALTWWRLREAGLPANQALQSIPLSERVITGAGALIIFLVVGAFLTAFVYAINRQAQFTGPMRHALIALVTIEVLLAIWCSWLLIDGVPLNINEATRASIVILG